MADALPGVRVRLSAVKEHLLCPKKVRRDTGWRSTDLPPRHGIRPVTKPAARGWEWRSFELETEDGRCYRLLCEVSPPRDKWKAMLIHLPATGAAVAVVRLEDQPGPSGGLHVHAHCDTNVGLSGAESVDMVYTLPDHGSLRRRRGGWTKALFCKAAGDVFRTESITGQEELTL